MGSYFQTLALSLNPSGYFPCGFLESVITGGEFKEAIDITGTYPGNNPLGSNNDLPTSVPGLIWQEQVFNRTYSWDGAGGAVGNAYPIGSGQSIACVIQPIAFTNGQVWYNGNIGSNGYGLYQLSIGSHNYLVVVNYNTQTAITGMFQITANNSNVYYAETTLTPSGVVNLYVGLLGNVPTAATPSSAGAVAKCTNQFIMADDGTGSQYWQGQITNLVVWPSVHTQAQVNALAATLVSPAPTQFFFQNVPQTGQVGQTLSPSPAVTLLDANGNITNSSASIVVAKASGPGSLTGTTTVTASNGQAIFDNLSLNAIGGYTLSAASTGLPTVTSPSFQIAAAPSSTMPQNFWVSTPDGWGARPQIALPTLAWEENGTALGLWNFANTNYSAHTVADLSGNGNTGTFPNGCTQGINRIYQSVGESVLGYYNFAPSAPQLTPASSHYLKIPNFFAAPGSTWELCLQWNTNAAPTSGQVLFYRAFGGSDSIKAVFNGGDPGTVTVTLIAGGATFTCSTAAFMGIVGQSQSFNFQGTYSTLLLTCDGTNLHSYFNNFLFSNQSINAITAGSGGFFYVGSDATPANFAPITVQFLEGKGQWLNIAQSKRRKTYSVGQINDIQSRIGFNTGTFGTPPAINQESNIFQFTSGTWTLLCRINASNSDGVIECSTANNPDFAGYTDVGTVLGLGSGNESNSVGQTSYFTDNNGTQYAYYNQGGDGVINRAVAIVTNNGQTFTAQNICMTAINSRRFFGNCVVRRVGNLYQMISSESISGSPPTYTNYLWESTSPLGPFNIANGGNPLTTADAFAFFSSCYGVFQRRVNGIWANTEDLAGFGTDFGKDTWQPMAGVGGFLQSGFAYPNPTQFITAAMVNGLEPGELIFTGTTTPATAGTWVHGGPGGIYVYNGKVCFTGGGAGYGMWWNGSGYTISAVIGTNGTSYWTSNDLTRQGPWTAHGSASGTPTVIAQSTVATFDQLSDFAMSIDLSGNIILSLSDFDPGYNYSTPRIWVIPNMTPEQFFAPDNYPALPVISGPRRLGL
jgi:hypothetical protein